MRSHKRIIVVIVSFAVFGASLFASRSARLDVGPEDWGPVNGIAIGPSAGWVDEKDFGNSFAAGLDFAYYHQITFPLYFWASTGVRMWLNDQQTPVFPYIETGLSVLLISAGAGYALGLNRKGDAVHYVNAFVAVNIPIWSPAKRHLFYISPYYRPTWDVSSDRGNVSSEIGGLIKWTFGFRKD